MIAWILQAWAIPWVRKAAFYGAGVLALLYGLRLWGNAQWEKGEKKGRETAVQSIEKDKLREWKEKAGVIAAQAGQLEADRKIVDAQSSELQSARRNLETGLSRSLKQIANNHEANNAQVIAVPADRLDNAIRGISGELAAGAAH